MSSWANTPFTWTLPDTFNFGIDVVDAWAQRTPTATALIAVSRNGSERRLSFAEIAARSSRLAAGLLGAGLHRGDRVMLLLPRVPQWHVAMVACFKAGLVPVPCVSMLTSADIAYRLHHGEIKGVIAHQSLVAKFASIDAPLTCCVSVGGGAPPDWHVYEDLVEREVSFRPESIARDDPSIFYFTSGSTGDPKGVVHAARSTLVRCWQPWRWLGLKPGDIVWPTTDMGWTKAATSSLFGPWYHGATTIVHESPNTDSVLEVIAEYGVTCLCVSATELRRLVARTRPAVFPRSLRLTISAGEAVTADLFEKWHAFSGTPLVAGYGQTETPMVMATPPDHPGMAETMGIPFPGNDIALVDENGCPVRTGCPGVIAVRRDNPGLMLGYWSVDGLNDGGTIRGEWYLTNDRAVCGPDGLFRFLGRADDVINASGYRIGPTEVENALLRHPAVRECAVVPSPDAERGEVVKAYIILNEAYVPSPELKSMLQQHVKSCIAPYKYPRRIEFVSEMPKNVSGKILRRVLKDREFGSGHTPEAEP